MSAPEIKTVVFEVTLSGPREDVQDALEHIAAATTKASHRYIDVRFNTASDDITNEVRR